MLTITAFQNIFIFQFIEILIITKESHVENIHLRTQD